MVAKDKQRNKEKEPASRRNLERKVGKTRFSLRRKTLSLREGEKIAQMFFFKGESKKHLGEENVKAFHEAFFFK